MITPSSNSSSGQLPEVLLSGYDLPVQGLADGNFTLIHSTAIVCLAISFLCAVLTVTLTMRVHHWRLRAFSSWPTGDRSLIYMALFDACFNLVHVSDHLLYLLQRDHPQPPLLCSFFGFMLSVFQIAQNIYVSCLALRACLMVFRMQLSGPLERDRRPLGFSLGSGLLFSGIVWSLDRFGPSGAFCYLDPIRAPVLLLVFTTLFLIGVGLFNLCFYLVTVIALHVMERRNRDRLGESSHMGRSVHRAAWTCSYFVISFFFQWTAMIVYGAWSLAIHAPPPFWLFMMVTTLTNLGGMFNLLLFAYLRLKRQQRRRRRPAHINSTLHRIGQMDTST